MDTITGRYTWICVYILAIGLTNPATPFMDNDSLPSQCEGGAIFYGTESHSSDGRGNESDSTADAPNSGKSNGSEKCGISDGMKPEDPTQCMRDLQLDCDPIYPYRTADGKCNNLNHPTWGSANECYLRFQPPFYDGYEAVRKSTKGGPLPGPRTLSLNIFTNLHRPTRKLSFMFTIYGQTVAHDVSMAAASGLGSDCCSTKLKDEDICLPIQLPADDPFYSQFNQTCINFHRHLPCTLCKTEKRQQYNNESGVFDISTVYSQSSNRADILRANDGTGKLRSVLSKRGGEILPSSEVSPGQFCVVKPESRCFTTGDIRVNQHASLTAMYTLFMREHNRLASVLKNLNPHWEEERLYQEARKINIAQIQCITYKNYLPHLLGPYLMEKFHLSVLPGCNGSQYKPQVRLGVWSEFAIAAFRLHSMIAREVGALDLRFKTLFQNPDIIRNGHMKDILHGVCKVPSEKQDHWFVKDVSDYMGQKPHKQYGVDLGAIDIQRGRDHGLAPYIYLVKFCSGGQIVISSFDDIPLQLMPQKSIDLLKENYKTVEDVDLYVGLLMEHHHPDSQVGPTAACIISKQFYFLKFGDRFYFEHEGQVPSFTPAQRNDLKQCSLSRILCDNNNIKHLQREVFLLPSSQNPTVSCNEIPRIDLTLWRETLPML